MMLSRERQSPTQFSKILVEIAVFYKSPEKIIFSPEVFSLFLPKEIVLGAKNNTFSPYR